MKLHGSDHQEQLRHSRSELLLHGRLQLEKTQRSNKALLQTQNVRDVHNSAQTIVIRAINSPIKSVKSRTFVAMKKAGNERKDVTIAARKVLGTTPGNC